MASVRSGIALIGLALASLLAGCGSAPATYNLEASLLCLSQRPEYEPGAGPYPLLRGRSYAFTVREDESRLPSLPGIYQLAKVLVHEANATPEDILDDPVYELSVAFLDTEAHADTYYDVGASLRRGADDPSTLVRRAGRNVVVTNADAATVVPERYWQLVTDCLKT